MTVHLTFWPAWWALFLLWVFGGGRGLLPGRDYCDLGRALIWTGGLLLFAGVAIGRLLS